jgi:hypothetical protein
MRTELRHIKIRDLFEGFADNAEEGGVLGYGGRLQIRPPYQREFVYDTKKQTAVVDTVRRGLPLSMMYWVDREDGTYEVLDGQQRTLSICSFLRGQFAHNFQFAHNLTKDELDRVLNYELTVYFCRGESRDKLNWFRVVNTSNNKLTEQELRNATYCGPWLTEAKRYFSKSNCPAHELGKDYLKGSPLRQDYLEAVLDWISDGNIEDYMAAHQNDASASELWLYFNSVIEWVKTIFPHYRKEMKGLPWGHLYNNHKGDKLSPVELEARITTLMMDEDVTKKSGIYIYVLTGEEKYLSLRAFTDKQKREAYERQEGICPIRGTWFDFDDMEADHIIPWSEGGRTTSENCQMVEKRANREKSNK